MALDTAADRRRHRLWTGFVVRWLFYVATALFLIWLIMLLLNNMRGRR